MSKADEAVLVDQWNRERFYEMDFSATQVEMLIRWGVSAHDVRPLVDAGCPRHLVMKIVRPLEEVPVVEAEPEKFSVKV